ncbi:MAG: hypothetical protein HY898_22300 [Deltaproteobacteria bacterium]|nr:hypothetical protein [Deltaproteobacteria bacterium]
MAVIFHPPSTGFRARVRALLRIGYPVVAAFAILVMARRFYGEMHLQTGGQWSAPLDDVFIHFDYARSIARGYPFEWSEGNGFSSGNTSITYPFVLALGYWVGFRGPLLMLWAAITACCSVLAYFLACQRLAVGLPPIARWLLPVTVLSLGALDWSLFSGMEVAFFLGVWGVALDAALHLRQSPWSRIPARSLWLGLVGAVVVATRPEGAAAIAILGLAAGALVWRTHRSRKAFLYTVLLAGGPAVAFLVLQGLVNRWLTGESLANGSIVKLALYNPFMTPLEKWKDYTFHLGYCFWRLVEHHFAHEKPYGWPFGWIPVLLALVPLGSKRTRPAAILLLASSVSFILLVAMNAQVRWQNERYTMPAVAWLFTSAGLGLGVLLSAGKSALARLTWPARALLGAALAALFVVHQAPNMRDQIWFFGRASRNIRDQHIRAGLLLRTLHPQPRRVAVGDAGALMYASDLPGLDIIGLGGFHRFPFARASVNGIGATIELIERMHPSDRPDILAVYPTWFPDFVMYFGHQIAAVPVEGNVICGGAEKGIYRADWHLLNTGARPSLLDKFERIVDEVDVADLMSEDDHHYRYQGPQTGFVQMRILADLKDPSRDVLDAGRVLLSGRTERFELRRPSNGATARLVVRAAPVDRGQVDVTIDGQPVGALQVEPATGWAELSMPLAPKVARERTMQVTFTARGLREWTNFHVWLVEKP